MDKALTAIKDLIGRGKDYEESVIGQFFEGKTILITGGSMGIGEAMAYYLAKYKTNLTLCARSVDLLQKVAQKCKDLGAKSVLTVKCDVTKLEDCKVAIDETIKQFKQLDCVILNAGISGSIKFEDMKELSLFYKMFETNFMGYVNIMHFALPHLKKAKDGRIGVISSMSGVIGVPLRTAYCSSKFAVNGFFSVLRNELGKNSPLKITLICPGWVDTTIRQRHVVETQKSYEKKELMPVDECVHKSLFAVATGKREEKFNFLQETVVPIANLVYPQFVDSLLQKKVSVPQSKL